MWHRTSRRPKCRKNNSNFRDQRTRSGNHRKHSSGNQEDWSDGTPLLYSHQQAGQPRAWRHTQTDHPKLYQHFFNVGKLDPQRYGDANFGRWQNISRWSAQHNRKRISQISGISYQLRTCRSLGRIRDGATSATMEPLNILIFEYMHN